MKQSYQAPVSAETAATGKALSPAESLSQATDVSSATADAGNVVSSTNPNANVQQNLLETQAMTPISSAEQAVNMMDASFNPQVTATDTNTLLQTQEPRSFLQKTGDYMFRGGQTPADIERASQAAADAELKRYGYSLKTLEKAPASVQNSAINAANTAGPNYIARFGPSVALAGIGAAGAGFFETPPEEENPLAEEFQQTGADLIAQSPEQFMLAGRDPRYSQGQYVVGSQYGMVPEQMLFNNPFMRYQDPQMQASPMRAAAGGEVYPRRNGGIMPNEGIPNQDSVRALLMPGEFVMTTNAVKGLGGGSMDRGINNMYSLMRNLETRGRAA